MFLMLGACVTNGSDKSGSEPNATPSTSASIDLFRKSVASKVRAGYILPERLAHKNLETTIGVNLTATGTIDSARIKKSSGSKVFDDLVLCALKRAEPLPPPPESVVGQEITMVFQ